MTDKKLNRFLFGGDYNPNQWPEEIWKEDMRIFKLADINVASINVFSWAKLQPSENKYNFEELDKIVGMLTQEGYDISMGTSTAALPAWMCKKYPEVTRTDFYGVKTKFGHRHNHCPSSRVFKDFSSKLVHELAKRYKDNENITIWHISNEYSGTCYCENCEKEFRVWLKDKYKTIEVLNEAWNTEFWSHTFYDWDEIVTPNVMGDGIGFNGKSAFSGISIDYDRFFSEALLDNYKMERDIVKQYIPNAVCTTNFMGKYKPLNYFDWAKELDIISWDSYPSYNTPISEISSNHALMRSLKHNQPWMLMEQTPSQQNWQPYNSLKKPGQMRSLSYQAISHGADTIQFFQLRRSVGACEKFHGAVIDHVGHENTRVFREVSQLGQELSRIGDQILHSRIKSEVAMIFDWESWWALEYSIGPSERLKYLDQFNKFYDVFYDKNISVDFVQPGDDLSDYKIVIAPTLYMVESDEVSKIESFVENGGIFITTYMSGISNKSDNVHLGGYPGPLKNLLGIWVEEFDALAPEQFNSITYNDNEYLCGLLCDIIHPTTAKVLALYNKDFYAGTPVVTKNKYGEGQAYYVGSSFETDFLEVLIDPILSELDIHGLGMTPKNVELSKRVHENGDEVIFLINHNNYCVKIENILVGETDLISDQTMEEIEYMEPFDVKIFYIERDRK